MTALRKNAINLLEQIPEDKLYYVVQIMQGINGLYNSDSQTEKAAAFERLETMRREVTDLDYTEELEKYREEKYGFAGVN
ncbi:MAG: UDP-N-acetylenolpyruvoylglucosamine reductase [Clostridiales bacterium]|nr:UDP-N-acetylenolpyruvoylglucosamine reductase [Clostridiales bacterium]